jgi:hypothetical protein
VNNTIRKLKLLGQTELTLVEITARRTVRSLAFAGLAVGLALLTILAVNGGAFFLLAIKNTQPSREEVLARDIRDLARQELNTELDQMGSVFSKGGGLGAGLSIAGPIVEWAIGLLRKRRK